MRLPAILSAISILLLWTSVAMATSIHVTWGYTPPMSPAVTGYRLYQEGVPVCYGSGPALQEMDCEVKLVKEVTIYTLPATFADGTERPYSAPYAFDQNGKLLAPWAFRR